MARVAAADWQKFSQALLAPRRAERTDWWRRMIACDCDGWGSAAAFPWRVWRKILAYRRKPLWEHLVRLASGRGPRQPPASEPRSEVFGSASSSPPLSPPNSCGLLAAMHASAGAFWWPRPSVPRLGSQTPLAPALGQSNSKGGLNASQVVLRLVLAFPSSVGSATWVFMLTAPASRSCCLPSCSHHAACIVREAVLRRHKQHNTERTMAPAMEARRGASQMGGVDGGLSAAVATNGRSHGHGTAPPSRARTGSRR